MTFWFSGRVALFQAIAALGLRAGAAVALPAFCCGSEVEPFMRAGLRPRFFRVTEALDPEPRSFAAALTGASAALATHYFGFAADLGPIRTACRSAGVPLIEDCAHALYSRDARGWLGEEADVAIFSVVKTLPVPDGGALVINARVTGSPSRGSLPPRRLVARRTRSLVIRHLQAHSFRPVAWAAHLPHAAKRGLGLPLSQPNRDTDAGLGDLVRFDQRLDDARMSRRSMRLLGQAAHAAIGRVRRRNYERLLAAVRRVPDLTPLFPALPEGTCPLALPVIASDPESFRRRLAATPGLGVKQMWPWFHPAVAWGDFPFEATLKRSVFMLPVHQSLEDPEIGRIIAGLRSWSPS